MKNKIWWYQECLKNSTDYHKEQIDNCIENYKRILTSIAEDKFRKIQIEEAIRQNKDSFDADKFMKNARLKAAEDAEQRIVDAIKKIADTINV